jgi:hypothetical protein
VTISLIGKDQARLRELEQEVSQRSPAVDHGSLFLLAADTRDSYRLLLKVIREFNGTLVKAGKIGAEEDVAAPPKL